MDWWTRGRFKSAKQPLETSINARWVHNRKTDEYGWPPTTTVRFIPRGDQQKINIYFGFLFAPTVDV